MVTRRITEMHITFVCDEHRKALEAILSGVRRACLGILSNFHVRTVARPRGFDPVISLILRFYPHVQTLIDPPLLAHAIERGANYLRMQNDMFCPENEGFIRIGALTNVQSKQVNESECIIEATFDPDTVLSAYCSTSVNHHTKN